jgi:hypothetical protein
MTHLTLTPEYIAVPDMDENKEYYVSESNYLCERTRPESMGDAGTPVYQLPGQYSIFCQSRTMTEGQAAEIVESELCKVGTNEASERIFKKYHVKWFSSELPFYFTPLESFHSLIQSLGGNTNENYLILKLEK